MARVSRRCTDHKSNDHAREKLQIAKEAHDENRVAINSDRTGLATRIEVRSEASVRPYLSATGAAEALRHRMLPGSPIGANNIRFRPLRYCFERWFSGHDSAG